eukprot:TRINITY_DN2611_c0_g1_i1.p2 TRINITY_DN2611_c0_g1~~TRINITY_DN2611_c0_g1_i1.p2  ORF type:complete len:155 (-),score=28.65 TRINITY_DN2611_c0_g1_i1:655-1119(-)
MGAGPAYPPPQDTRVQVEGAGYPNVQAYGTFPGQPQPAPPPMNSSGYVSVNAVPVSQPVLRSYYEGERLPFCGCGVGMMLFLVGFILPIAWFVGLICFFFVASVYSDRREYNGLLACTIAACFVAVVGLSGGGWAFIKAMLFGDDDDWSRHHHH